MKNLLTFIFKKFTIGSLLSLMIWIFLAYIFRHFYDFIPLIYTAIGDNVTLEVIHLTILASIRFLIRSLLEWWLGDLYMVQITDYKLTTTLFMEESKPEGESSKGGSSKGIESSKSSERVHKSLEGMSKDEFEKLITKLGDDMHGNCDTRMQMIIKLREIMSEKDVAIFSDKGNLEISVPSTMSQKESESITKQIGIIDRIINGKVSEYKALSKQDKDINNGKHGKFWNQYDEACKDLYESNFNAEDE